MPGLNFENFENDGGTTIFNVFKVSSLGQLAGTGRRNFENYENAGATTIFKVFRGVTGPRPVGATTPPPPRSRAPPAGTEFTMGARPQPRGAGVGTRKLGNMIGPPFYKFLIFGPIAGRGPTR